MKKVFFIICILFASLSYGQQTTNEQFNPNGIMVQATSLTVKQNCTNCANVSLSLDINNNKAEVIAVPRKESEQTNTNTPNTQTKTTTAALLVNE